jgi:hypothetical protein
MFRQLSMSAEALYQHHAQRIAMQIIAEREALERASRCGKVATFDGFEDALAELILEKFE